MISRALSTRILTLKLRPALRFAPLRRSPASRPDSPQTGARASQRAQGQDSPAVLRTSLAACCGSPRWPVESPSGIDDQSGCPRLPQPSSLARLFVICSQRCMGANSRPKAIGHFAWRDADVGVECLRWGLISVYCDFEVFAGFRERGWSVAADDAIKRFRCSCGSHDVRFHPIAIGMRPKPIPSGPEPLRPIYREDARSLRRRGSTASPEQRAVDTALATLEHAILTVATVVSRSLSRRSRQHSMCCGRIAIVRRMSTPSWPSWRSSDDCMVAMPTQRWSGSGVSWV
ncbi:hypothetical protein SAMN05192580_2138 [Sphingomonas jatrophae]|uniref:Uncharacterized protein n=1 Tax=Sphingomonas jatrophae TaxID=1166337 RepID=A0A1I6L1R0_9SPHN|nr:hypothetical protein SAMN05192580_2138 [Sphingomonas jatrophae]